MFSQLKNGNGFLFTTEKEKKKIYIYVGLAYTSPTAAIRFYNAFPLLHQTVAVNVLQSVVLQRLRSRPAQLFWGPQAKF